MILVNNNSYFEGILGENMKKLLFLPLIFISGYAFCVNEDSGGLEFFKRRLGNMNYYSMQNQYDIAAYNIRLTRLKDAVSSDGFVKKYVALRDQSIELKKTLDKEFSARKPDVSKIESLVSELNDVQSKIDSLLKEYGGWQDSLKK